MKRSIVAVKNNNSNYKIVRFPECLLECFNKDGNSVTVNCSFKNGILLLEESEEGYEMRHSPECPIKLISNSNADKIDKNDGSSNVRIATSVVIESSDSHVLLTRRTHKMRSSPNVWVTPGGHIDESDETIFSAGVREVKEETGLDISDRDISILGLWENVYPLLLGIGTPKNHTLIVYTHVLLNESHEKLTQKIIPNPEEVSSYCWLKNSNLIKLFNSNQVFTPIGKQYLVQDGKLIQNSLDYSTMFNKWLWKQIQPYSGVNFALKKWLDKIYYKKMSSKF